MTAEQVYSEVQGVLVKADGSAELVNVELERAQPEKEVCPMASTTYGPWRIAVYREDAGSLDAFASWEEAPWPEHVRAATELLDPGERVLGWVSKSGPYAEVEKDLVAGVAVYDGAKVLEIDCTPVPGLRQLQIPLRPCQEVGIVL